MGRGELGFGVLKCEVHQGDRHAASRHPKHKEAGTLAASKEAHNTLFTSWTEWGKRDGKER